MESSEGRLKGQAFGELPAAASAQQALEEIHGLLLHEKPLVVVRCARRYAVRAVVDTAVTRPTIKTSPLKSLATYF